LGRPTEHEPAPTPLYDAQCQVALLFEGRLTHRQRLMAELGADVHPNVMTDAQLVLTAYCQWGKSFVEHLEGHFVMVVADQRRRQVLLCRDRLGVRPLYLAQVNGRLRFASTLPALLAGGGVDTTVDRTGLHHYMSWHSIVPAPRTVLAGVTKLPAATVRVIDANGQQDHLYWQPRYGRSATRTHWDPEDWQTAIQAALTRAVRRNIVSTH